MILSFEYKNELNKNIFDHFERNDNLVFDMLQKYKLITVIWKISTTLNHSVFLYIAEYGKNRLVKHAERNIRVV